MSLTFGLAFATCVFLCFQLVAESVSREGYGGLVSPGCLRGLSLCITQRAVRRCSKGPDILTGLPETELCAHLALTQCRECPLSTREKRRKEERLRTLLKVLMSIHLLLSPLCPVSCRCAHNCPLPLRGHFLLDHPRTFVPPKGHQFCNSLMPTHHSLLSVPIHHLEHPYFLPISSPVLPA